MTCYHLFRPLLFMLPPERAHHLALWALRANMLPRARITSSSQLHQTLWGMDFVHPVGLAAGFDKNAEAVDALHAQGFSFVEAGTVTPLPQAGNEAPRMFRLRQDGAVINRLGFNNQGLAAFVENMSRCRHQGIIGVNIGKNKDAVDAVADYLAGLEAAYRTADYITVNISSPNTQGLRAMQKREQLTQLLTRLLQRRAELIQQTQKNVPLLLKIAPDLDGSDVEDVAAVVMELQLDGVIVSNTTIKRPRTLQSRLHSEQGGLSGQPLFDLSTQILSRMYQLTGGSIPLIGVGGIGSVEQAYAKIRAGASLVQLYTALVYEGFGLVKRIADGLPALLERDGFTTITQAIGADHR